MEPYRSEHPGILESLGGAAALMRTLSAPLEPLRTGISPVHRVIPGIRSVVFDVYGTLFVSGSGEVGTAEDAASDAACELALRESGFTVAGAGTGRFCRSRYTEEILEAHRTARSLGVRYPEVDIVTVWHRVLLRLAADRLITGEITPARLVRVAVRYEALTNPVWPMPSLAETLGGLSRAGFRLGIVSNAQFYTPLLFRAFLDAPPDRLGFDERLCVWSYRLGEAKPSPATFTELVTALDTVYGIRPNEALFVGNDMLNDVSAAADAGLRTVLFAGDRRSLRLREDDPRCTAVKPDAVILDLIDILSLLG
jgi:putative hydrolase of the HAD superfamily